MPLESPHSTQALVPVRSERCANRRAIMGRQAVEFDFHWNSENEGSSACDSDGLLAYNSLHTFASSAFAKSVSF